MYKRLLLVMSTAGVVGLAAYSLMPVPASGVQLDSGLSAIPVAADSNVILIKDDKDGGKKGSSGSSGSSGSRGSSTRQFKPQGAGSGSGSGGSRSTRQFKKQGAGSSTASGSGGSSTRQFRQQGVGSSTSGGGGNWQRQGRWHRGDRWSGGFWRSGLWILFPFVIGDPCYDYVERWPGGPLAWVYVCEE